MAGSILLRWLLMPSQRLSTVVCSVESSDLARRGVFLHKRCRITHTVRQRFWELGLVKKPTV